MSVDDVFLLKAKITRQFTPSGTDGKRKSEFFDIAKLPRQLIPYAFLEEMQVGGDFTEYLSPSLIENKDMLRDFFGNYIGVMPPPFFRKPEEVGVVYKKIERIYFTKYYIFEFENGKISNVKNVD